MAPKKQNSDEDVMQVSLDSIGELVRAASSAVLLPDLQKFNGESSTVEAKEWLRSVESQAVIARWNEQQKLETARRLLTNAGKSWYLLNAGEIQSWKDFRKLFYASFIGEDEVSVIDKWERFSSRVQKDKESVREYILEKLRLAKDVGATVRESKGAVCSGLKSADLANYLKVFDYNVAADWLNRVREFESIKIPKSDGGSRSKNWSNNFSIPVKNPNSESNSSGKYEPTNDSNDGSSQKVTFCYNCKQKTDHISKNCPQPRRPKFCALCRTEGHSKKDCPSNTREDTSKSVVGTSTKNPEALTSKPTTIVGAVSESKTTEADYSGQKYVKTAFVDGKPIPEAMIDPGSRVCVIRASTAIKLNIPVQPSNTRIFGVGDLETGTEVLGYITASVTVDGVKVKDIELLIISDNSLPVPLLIGRSWTEHPAVATVKWRDHFIITSASDKWFDELPGFDKDSCITSNRVISEKNFVNFIHTEPVALSFGHFEFGESLSKGDREKFLALLNKYRKCFALNIFELGTAKVPPIDIEVIPGSVPAASKPYRTNAADAAEMSRQISEWRKAGIVVDTSSPYAAPGFLVGKKNGKRPVFDYRKLNSQVVKIYYPLPNIDDHLNGLAEDMVFCVLDLACGYLQFPLSESAQAKTAFVTPNESGQFTKLPFGYTNAPAEFSQRMTYVWRKLKYVRKYLDDTLVPARNIEELFVRLEEVLKTLLEFNLTCRPEKCKIAVEVVEFLGFEIGRGEIRPGNDKIKAIEKFPPPTDVHSVRRFVGLTSFFRRFLKNFALRIAPLTNLTKKNTPFQWSKIQQDAFTEIRQALIQRPVLRLFDPKANTELHTDASKDGVAGMLLQRKDPTQPLHLVYAVSKKTTEQEAKYHSSKTELLAIVWSISRLRQFLLGIHFTIVTDCQALLHLNAQKTTNAQVARWALLLQEYDFVVRHRKGDLMQHADALSRAPVEEAQDTEAVVNVGVFQILTEDEIVRMYQHRDEYIRNIVETELPNSDRFQLIDGILYFVDKETNDKLFVVPKTMRKALCIKYHDSLGHFSTEKVVAAIRKHYWFPGMRRYIRVHIRNCIDCLLAKGTSGKSQGLLNPIPPGSRPFETVHVDHLGPFTETATGNNYVFVLVCNLTKFVCLWTVPNTSTDGVEKCLREFFITYGLPNRIVSDRGTCFTAEKYKNFCAQRGIQVHLVATRHPRANGQCERINRILNAQLRIYASSSIEEIEDWDRFIPEIQRNINLSINRSTGRAPFELLHGYTPRTNESTLSRIIRKADACDDLEIMRTIAQEEIVKSQEKMKNAFDKRHCIGDTLNVGEIVFIKRPSTTKLQTKFCGPMTVVERVGGDIYRIQDLRREGTAQGMVDLHISQIRPWRPEVVDDSNSDEESSVEDDTELQNGRV